MRPAFRSRRAGLVWQLMMIGRSGAFERFFLEGQRARGLIAVSPQKRIAEKAFLSIPSPTLAQHGGDLH